MGDLNGFLNYGINSQSAKRFTQATNKKSNQAISSNSLIRTTFELGVKSINFAFRHDTITCEEDSSPIRKIEGLKQPKPNTISSGFSTKADLIEDLCTIMHVPNSTISTGLRKGPIENNESPQLEC